MKKNMFPVDARRSILPYDFSHDVHTERLVGLGAEKYRTYLFFVAVNRHGSSLTASTAKPITDSLQEINPCAMTTFTARSAPSAETGAPPPIVAAGFCGRPRQLLPKPYFTEPGEERPPLFRRFACAVGGAAAAGAVQIATRSRCLSGKIRCEKADA